MGNGEARNCADPSHNHTIHGGSFWAEAFYTIMARVRAGVPAKSAMYMTEGAKEEVSGAGFDILLGLQWQGLPYWSAIYGGYGYSTGRAGSVNQPLAGGLCIELTKQFMVGGTMGWFTYERYCHDGGDASTACSFLDLRNAAYVGYIRRLSAARVAVAWAEARRVVGASPGAWRHSCRLRKGKLQISHRLAPTASMTESTTRACESRARCRPPRLLRLAHHVHQATSSLPGVEKGVPCCSLPDPHLASASSPRLRRYKQQILRHY